MSIFITTSMALLFSTVVACIQRSSHTRPAGLFGEAGLDSLGTGSIATSSLAGRTGGLTRRPHRALEADPGSQDQLR
jgi:hypothetical protein